MSLEDGSEACHTRTAEASTSGSTRRVGVSGGCEAAAHAVHAFVQSPVLCGSNIFIKLGM